MAFRGNDRRGQKKQDLVRRNERIRIPKVRVVDEDGEQLGVLDTRDALDRAKEKGLDLVEVAPNADPPVCKIMDYGKFKYQQQKKLQEAKKKQTVIKIKEVKFRPKTDEHDYQTKLNKILQFLDDGDRCKVTVFFRGREIVHKDRGLKMLERVVTDTVDVAKVESRPMSEGRTMTMMLAPVKK
ncbi:MAG: translation initiation factor IF-3 [Pseudodesulfovibrio sp.]|uniref:translation initiation factor IF-3 n=1 Tax=Pseudodesulfovibrio TaxID=2035811 RepID=UPI000A01C4CF|nr:MULTISPECIES: translation initiation factor IF-3 [Pseudodesulfovibrio]MBU4244144.1 translation initiation factor IF-3 [Pseudomonadota bacterium]MBU4377926.1 translation initiation factor IF-3 [Pseudomonadota bacterium]MBU4475864.1 translation initiation factor IF-3 [Pseudomonadota bacterium]MBU4516702.1 translation initiation factor IF-3 [Pseudomonadota bacterium]MBU4522659.1 translation initiation factor IF-3 [Pseudomonadota bacterium]